MEKNLCIREINEKLKKGEAVVMTSSDFKEEVRRGHRFSVGEVDVVTCATRSVMSGTAAMFVVPVTGPGVFTRAEKIRLNGVPGVPGPAPNERLGVVDVLIHGTAHSKYDPMGYGGGHLFRDMLEGKEIHAEVESVDGRFFESHFTLKDLDFARFYTFRNNFMNYMAFANFKNMPSYRENPRSIFAPRYLPQGMAISFSGNGGLSPLENDKKFRTIHVGSKVLLNKAPGVVVGSGTRSKPEKANLSIVADMLQMDPEFIGGFKTSDGPEITNSVALPISLLSQEVIDGVAEALDENIPLPIADIGDRIPLEFKRYSDAWSPIGQPSGLEMEFDPDRCICCSFSCVAEYYCPMEAISWRKKEIDQKKCFGCGACTMNCLGGAFKEKGREYRGSLGVIQAQGFDLPVVFRQSDRRRSLLLEAYLKELMERGQFLLTETDMPIVILTPQGEKK
ncbi:MAG: methanogenesis marker 16 metalloprotein [Deltaproteobacteria bacterium]|nr:methanogenesis marker 16 metalloprotein [Deltaproteobacteria bacterium]